MQMKGYENTKYNVYILRHRVGGCVLYNIDLLKATRVLAFECKCIS
jgi:hypothetical protein